MVQAHVARAALATLRMNELLRPFLTQTPCPVPMQARQVLLPSDRSRARVRLESSADHPRRGLHGGDAGHGSGVNLLHPIPQRSPIGFAQQKSTTQSIPREL